MSISFKCPWCDNLCAFADKHGGRGARCQKCNGHFTIPSKQGEAAARIKAKATTPVAGFWRAVATTVPRMLFKRESITGLVFVAVLVCLRFFIGHTDYSITMPGFRLLLPTGQIACVVSWGLLFCYYMETVNWAAMDYYELPEVIVDRGFAFMWNIVKSLYLFVIAIIFAELPFFIIIRLLKSAGIEIMLLSRILVLCGLFVFPMYVLFLSTGKELWMTVRIDYIFKPIIRGFCAYCVPALLVILVMVAEWTTVDYGKLIGESGVIIGMHLAGSVATAYLGLVAMRTIGLFDRHYGCYLPDCGQEESD